MAPQIIHLPDGQTFTVTPIFAGVGFKSHELTSHSSAFPVGWTVVLHTEDDDVEDGVEGSSPDVMDEGGSNTSQSRTRPFRVPTLQNDALFISSIANPPSSEFKPATSPSRQIAMMLWITMYWYFHQPEPSPYMKTAASESTPEKGRPRGEWKIKIRRQGVLAGRYIMAKLERMGLIASTDTSVGSSDENDEGWNNMFISRRMFWQIPARLFLFTLQPTKPTTSVPESPIGSRPQSPVPFDTPRLHYLQNNSQSSQLLSLITNKLSHKHTHSDLSGTMTPNAPHTVSFPLGHFYSTSHLPTYFPPAPLQYTFTNDVRHPLRPKPSRMGEVFYARFVPSVGAYLSFRVASSSSMPVPYTAATTRHEDEHAELCNMSDTLLLERWMSNPRVKAFWGEYTPNFLKDALSSQHSFPAIGLWDGVPFGYFEIYWVKEDILGRRLGNDAEDWDRGLHILIGEEWARGRVKAWLTSLVHWCLNADFRTMRVCLEPRVDNERFIQHLESAGFAKEGQVTFPHKQSWLLRIKREVWEGPSL